MHFIRLQIKLYTTNPDQRDQRTHLAIVVAGTGEERTLPGEEEPWDSERRPRFRLPRHAPALPPVSSWIWTWTPGRGLGASLGRGRQPRRDGQRSPGLEKRAVVGFSWLREGERMNEYAVLAGPDPFLRGRVRTPLEAATVAHECVFCGCAS